MVVLATTVFRTPSPTALRRAYPVTYPDRAEMALPTSATRGDLLMLLSDWRLLLRRWYALVVGLLLTLGMGLLAAALVPVSYVATAHVVLLPPRGSEGQGRNPYLALGSLGGMVDVVSLAAMDDDTARALKAKGVSGTYRVAPDQTTSGPVLVVTTEEPTAARAAASMDAVLRQVPETTLRLQTDTKVPPGVLVEASLIGRDGSPVRTGKSQLRAVLVAVAAGAAFTLLGTAFLDSWLTRRSIRRDGARAATPPDPKATPDAEAPASPVRDPAPAAAVEVDREARTQPLATITACSAGTGQRDAGTGQRDGGTGQRDGGGPHP
jgi:hypothetical protein